MKTNRNIVKMYTVPPPNSNCNEPASGFSTGTLHGSALRARVHVQTLTLASEQWRDSALALEGLIVHGVRTLH